MKVIKALTCKIAHLLKEILLFWFGVTKRLVLPKKNRKGNVLSSIYDLFVGTIEKLETFEYGVFNIRLVLRYKYIKQSLLIVSGILLLLSTLEWESKNVFSSTPTHHISTNRVAEVKGTSELKKETDEVYFSAVPLLHNHISERKTLFRDGIICPAQKIHLRINCFRI